MKNTIKNIYILTLLFTISFLSFVSATTNKIITKNDCYWKNDAYQCTIKTCKRLNLKSCTYKTIKTNPPVYKTVTSKLLIQAIVTVNNSWYNAVVTSSWLIASWSIASSGFVYTWSKIIPISNTKNTISGLSKFYDTISGAIIINNSWARYSIVEFGDFECIYCQKFHNKKILETVMSKYPFNINYYFVNYPLTKIHVNAQYLAKWYICTLEQDQKQAITYIDFVYSQTIGDVVLLLNEWKKWLDQRAFENCMNGTGSDQIIKNQIYIGDKVWVTGTPSVLMINNDTSEYELIAWSYGTWAYNSVIINREDQLTKFPYIATK